MEPLREKKQLKAQQHTQPIEIDYWEKIRGLWKNKPVDGLAYQRRIRRESDTRLKYDRT